MLDAWCMQGACTMTFQTDGKKGAKQTVRVRLPPRTLQVRCPCCQLLWLVTGQVEQFGACYLWKSRGADGGFGIAVQWLMR